MTTEIELVVPDVGDTWTIYCDDKVRDPNIGIDRRWAWPPDWEPGYSYSVVKCPVAYFRLGHAILPPNARAGDKVWVNAEGGEESIWILTGDMHPTENAMLGRWPD